MLNSEDKHVLNRENCKRCFACADSCYSRALSVVGEDVSVDYLINENINQKPYFTNGKGGVTFSGGECMLQIEPLLELLKTCREEGIHTAIDTAGRVGIDLLII